MGNPSGKNDDTGQNQIARPGRFAQPILCPVRSGLCVVTKKTVASTPAIFF
jgi:hypothetical protein